MELTCYANKGKFKSATLCEAFADGAVRACGATVRVCYEPVDKLLPGAAVFYGVRPHQYALLEQARMEGRDWYYIDNAYFDSTRERCFRITRNRMQHSGSGKSDGKRFDALNISIARQRTYGKHVLVCPQSDEFMKLFCSNGAHWTKLIVERLRHMTQREIRVRAWQANKVEWYRTLGADLENCWALVTFSSASAITAMLAGIPAFVTADDCISRPVANLSVDRINKPDLLPALYAWCGVVADNQFTTDEIASGYAWTALQA